MIDQKEIKKYLIKLSKGDSRFVYEVTSIDKKRRRNNTKRSKSIPEIIQFIEKHQLELNREIVISPWLTRYPVGTSGFEFGRSSAAGHICDIDFDFVSESTAAEDDWEEIFEDDGILSLDTVKQFCAEIGYNKEKSPTFYRSGTGIRAELRNKDWLGADQHAKWVKKTREYFLSKANQSTNPLYRSFKVDIGGIHQQFRLPGTCNIRRGRIVKILEENLNPQCSIKLKSAYHVRPHTHAALKKHRLKIKQNKQEKIVEKTKEIKKSTPKYILDTLIKVFNECRKKDKNDKRKSFIEGCICNSKRIKIKNADKIIENVGLTKEQLYKIIGTLDYATEDYLAAETCGIILNCSKMYASKILKALVKHEILLIKDSDNSARCYKINIQYKKIKIKNKLNPLAFVVLKATINGIGESSMAMYKLGLYCFKFSVNLTNAFERWCTLNYDKTSKEHSQDELLLNAEYAFNLYDSGRRTWGHNEN